MKFSDKSPDYVTDNILYYIHNCSVSSYACTKLNDIGIYKITTEMWDNILIYIQTNTNYVLT